MSEEVKLANCPFCNSEGQINGRRGLYWASCISDECYCQLGYDTDNDGMFLTKEETAKAWNRRAQTVPLQVAQELREALENIVQDVQEWCDAVEEDSSWDGWDSHYKHFAYNGGLDAARAVLKSTLTKGAAS